MRPILFAVLAFLAIAMPVSPLRAQSDWIAKKCALYTDAWSRALSSNPNITISENFRTANEDFISSGCVKEITVCPRSKDELELANTLAIVMLNEGAASTFMPFACDDE